MTNSIHTETPDGKVVKPEELATGGRKEPTNTNDANDNAAGPKANPDPRANSNLEDKDKNQKATGTGTEVTDGEAG